MLRRLQEFCAAAEKLVGRKLSHVFREGVEKGTGYLAEKVIPFLKKR